METRRLVIKEDAQFVGDAKVRTEEESLPFLFFRKLTYNCRIVFCTAVFVCCFVHRFVNDAKENTSYVRSFVLVQLLHFIVVVVVVVGLRASLHPCDERIIQPPPSILVFIRRRFYIPGT